MKKHISKRLVTALTAAVLCATAVGSLPMQAEEKYTSFPYTIEGEDMDGAELWTQNYGPMPSGSSGKGHFYLQQGSASFTVTVPEDAMYSIVVRGAQTLDKDKTRMQTVEVNGTAYTLEAEYSEEWTDYDFGMVRLRSGENEIKFTGAYGYMAIDTVTVSEAEFPDLSSATDKLRDPKAIPEAQALMSYLHSVYGTNILAGQQEIYGGGHPVQTTIRYDKDRDICVDAEGNTYTFSEDSKDVADDGSTFVWTCYDEDGQAYGYNTQNRNYTYNDYNYEMKYLEGLTGKLPAIHGYDFGSYCPCYAWDDGVAGRMIDWTNNKGGICTASWHINVPKEMASYTYNEPLAFDLTTYSEKTDFVTANCMIEGTAEYDYFQLCMKNLAVELLKLQDAGVPVIFRPFHEAEGNPSHTEDPLDGSGSWFWWAKEGAAVYKDLWALLQDTLENEYGLHNLIWEQNLYTWSNASAGWYVGDDRVDIVAFDKYNVNYNRHDGKPGGSGPNEDAEAGIFYKINEFVGGEKMIAMAENDTVPSLTNLSVERAGWLYFCPWYDSEQEPFVSGEKYQNPETLKEIYQSEYCITLDELPADLFSASSDPRPSEPTVEGTTEKPSAPSDVHRGDVNEDGEVDIMDVIMLNKNLLGGCSLTEKGKANADVDGSGVPDPTDSLTIMKFIVGLIEL